MTKRCHSPVRFSTILGHRVEGESGGGGLQFRAGEPPTLCRMERRADREWAVAAHRVLFARFAAAHRVAPKRLVPGFDATYTRLHGGREGPFFHGYHGHYCYLPL